MPNASPFRFLFRHALLHNQTSFGESGTEFSIIPREGETVLLFRTDNENRSRRGNIVERFSDHYSIKDDEPRSDLLLFYAVEKPNEFKYRLVFIELKGLDVEHAVKQITRMVRAVREKLSPIFGEAFFNCHNLQALVITKRPPPDTKLKQLQQRFFKELRFSLHLCHPQKEEELREILTRF